MLNVPSALVHKRESLAEHASHRSSSGGIAASTIISSTGDEGNSWARLLMAAHAYGQIAGAAERIRIGVIGCGEQANAHMRALVRMRESDNLDILNVCDIYNNDGPNARMFGSQVSGILDMSWKLMMSGSSIPYAYSFLIRYKG